MKAAFLCEDPGNILNAYSESLRVEMAEEFELLPEILTMKGSAEELRALGETEVIFSSWGMPCLGEAEIKEKLPKLKAVFYGAGSVQAFARPYLACGVRIFSAWAANAVPVAEYTVAQIILANKGCFQRMQRVGDWSNKWPKNPMLGNYGADIGIVGAGMIGKLVIKMLRAYRLNVFVFDPFLSEEEAAELGATKLGSLTELFARCQVISNHLANNAETVGMLNAECFNAMKKNGVFINTGRGAQVVETELVAAMRAEPERLALLDVTWPEPPEEGSELYTTENIILTPHIAGSLGSEIGRMGEYMFDEAKRWLRGGETRYEVSEAMLATMA